MNRISVVYEVHHFITRSFRAVQLQLRRKIRYSFRHYPFQSAMVAGFCLLFVIVQSLPHGGRILPVDPHMVKAYSQLEKTRTGRQLIKRVKKSTAGSYINCRSVRRNVTNWLITTAIRFVE